MTPTPDHPHRRRNPLTGQWVLVSPHRLARPWHGEEETSSPSGPSFDPACYLCPGNTRAAGAVNPAYKDVFVFENDYPALLPDFGRAANADPLFASEPVGGTCRVICYSPDHANSLPDLPREAVRRVVDCWCEQTAELGADWRWVQIFENKGAAMGCSNPHPHGQIWATRHLPDEAETEDRNQRDYFATHGAAMLVALAEREAALGDRVVAVNDCWLAIVPYWASWPFETLLLPRFAIGRLPELKSAQRDDLAEILIALTQKFDALFGCPFPYSMGWHGAPFGESDIAHWQLHAHFYPPLLRSASVRKFMVGYELLAEAQRDLLPETAAAMLRAAA